MGEVSKQRGEITIPAPIVDHDQNCLVLNYRTDKWEPGLLIGLEYKNRFGSWGWVYTVVLERRGPKSWRAKIGRPIRLSVNDDGIKPLDEEDVWARTAPLGNRRTKGTATPYSLP